MTTRYNKLIWDKLIWFAIYSGVSLVIAYGIAMAVSEVALITGDLISGLLNWVVNEFV